VVLHRPDRPLTRRNPTCILTKSQESRVFPLLAMTSGGVSTDTDSPGVDRPSPGAETERSGRRPWTAKEDAALRAAVGQYGPARGPGSAWSKISAAVGESRTNKVGGWVKAEP
jgi:hypothetical protein